ncbi:MAG: ATP-binding protein [bacterium]|nr:ATP-binding protein [bacterium]
MKLRTKFSLITVVAVVILSVLLEFISIFIFTRQIHTLNKELFSEKLDRLVLFAYEQDELFFEGVSQTIKDGQRRTHAKLDVIYRNDKDPNTFIFVVDGNGKVIFHPAESRWRNIFNYQLRKDDVLFSKDISDLISQNNEGEFEYISPDRKQNWVVYKKYEPWNWVFCMTTTKHYLNTTTVSFIRFALLVSSCVIIFSILITIIILSKFTKPIHLVIEQVQKIAKGEISSIQKMPLNVKTDDETGMLAHAVNKMAEDLSKVTVSRDELVREIEERTRVEERFRIVAQSVTDMIYDWNIQTGKVDWFGDIDKNLGYLPGEFPHTIEAWGKSIHPEDRDRVMAALDEHLEKKTPYYQEYRMLRKDGNIEYWVDQGTALSDENNKPYRMLGACSNITERKKAEEEKEKLKKQLFQSEKMSAIGQLAGGVAHEINNPMGVILGFSQSIAKRIKDDDPLYMPLKSIEREAIRCKKLIGDLLTFSRVSKTKTEMTDINKTIEETLSLIEAQAKVKDIEIIKKYGFNLPQITVNKNQIQQVIVNICNNAIDAIPKGGNLTITTQITTDKKSAEISGKEFVVIGISDTGKGMTEEVKKHIFEPFYTTKEVGKGTGLGLSLCYEIIQKHRGTIEVESELGKGANFTIKLPMN